VTLKTPVADTPPFRSRFAALRATQGHGRHASLTALEQRVCPVSSAKLGSMGDPISVEVDARQVWTCCKDCLPKLTAQPAKYLARLEPPPQDQVLSVPESAVIDSGTRKIVYVESAPGVFDGREVVLGPRIGDRFPVLDGLAPGERVAADGAFLIDAESRINPSSTQVVAPEPHRVAGAPPRNRELSNQGAARH
jgi:membrane fusion protein, copper/silver efflux system